MAGVYKRTEEHRRKIGLVHRKPRETRTCAAPGCDVTFEVIVTSKRKYCCSGHSRKGRPGWNKDLTKETDPRVAKQAEKITGVRQSKETIEKKRKALVGRSYIELHGEERANEILRRKSASLLGSNSPNWQGGTSDNEAYYSFEFRRARIQVKERDNYTCQLCGKIEEDEVLELGRGLAVHHIDYIVTDNHDPSNLITLCCRCNSKVNFNRDYWMKFFRSKLKEKILVA